MVDPGQDAPSRPAMSADQDVARRSSSRACASVDVCVDVDVDLVEGDREADRDGDADVAADGAAETAAAPAVAWICDESVASIVDAAGRDRRCRRPVDVCLDVAEDAVLGVDAGAG